MDKIQEILKEMIESMGFEDFSINYDAEKRRLAAFVNDDIVSETILPTLVNNLDYLMKLVVQKNNLEPVFIDINNYRKKREGLILEIAKATARKATAEKREIELPAMNAHERRLAHMELSSHPDVKTESIGEGKERRIIIKPIL